MTSAASQTWRDGIVAAIPNLRAFAISLCGNHAMADGAETTARRPMSPIRMSFVSIMPSRTPRL